MGTWGTKLYDNDTACDIRDEYTEKIKRGKDSEEATNEMIAENQEIFSYPDDEALFWLSLADTQWEYGRLLQNVKDMALLWINKIKDIEEISVQKDEIDKLHSKLLSPQPPIKKFRKSRLYKCEWKIGDVFAYKLESELAKEKGLLGRYLLIQKVDEDIWHPGHIIPIVYVKITNDEKIPTNIEEYNQLEYIQISFTKYSDRFFPINGSRPQEDIAEKSKIKYEVDEFGFLPEFRIEIITTSKKNIPIDLSYIGNFSNSIRPKNEYIPHSKFNICSTHWNKKFENFEITIINAYKNHNLRELKIYSKKPTNN
ncbi:MAG: DUF4259 domain-containing protein [Clostridia bacterium]|nr:DUF4259 domain-containing protein [Clostridia bacterium]